jgi:hypothetical protein
MITHGSTITPEERALVQYYDLKKNWRKVRPHIANPEVEKIFVRDINRFTYRWRDEFKPQYLPFKWWSHGRQPEFWNYTKHAACHWLVNFSLRLAQLVEPDHEWRIITSPQHSTVWDGKHVLFEFNFQAMAVPATECFELAYKNELKPGDFLKIHCAEYYWMEIARDGVASLVAAIEPLETVTISAEEQELLATIKAGLATVTQAVSKLEEQQQTDLNRVVWGADDQSVERAQSQ